MVACGLWRSATGRAKGMSAWLWAAAALGGRPVPPFARGCARGRLVQCAPEAP